MKPFLAIALFVAFVCPVSGQTLDQYMSFIEYWEGRKHEAYKCSEGFLTIGVGHRINKDIGPLSDDEIDSLLKADTLKAIKDAKEVVFSFEDQPPVIRFILVDMAFNLGKRGLSGFEKTIHACNIKDYSMMYREMIDSKWYTQTGRRSKSHVKAVKKLASYKSLGCR